MSGLALRPAAPADLPLLRRWHEQPHVVASVGDDDWGWEVELARSPAWREQLIAELDGRGPVGQTRSATNSLITRASSAG